MMVQNTYVASLIDKAIIVIRFSRRFLYSHHFNTQILPPLDSYINEQPMRVCVIANSSSVCFS